MKNHDELFYSLNNPYHPNPRTRAKTLAALVILAFIAISSLLTYGTLWLMYGDKVSLLHIFAIWALVPVLALGALFTAGKVANLLKWNLNLNFNSKL